MTIIYGIIKAGSVAHVLKTYRRGLPVWWCGESPTSSDAKVSFASRREHHDRPICKTCRSRYADQVELP